MQVQKSVLMYAGCREYAFFVEGFDVESRYGVNVVDNGTSEWFSITKWTPPKHGDLKV